MSNFELEPIKQREILESRLQLALLKKSIVRLVNHIDVNDSNRGVMSAENYVKMKNLFFLRSKDLLDYNIITYGLAFSSLILLSKFFIEVQQGGLVNEYIAMMEDSDYWLQTSDETFSVEVAVLFVYNFFLNLYQEAYIDFAIIDGCNGEQVKVNRVLKDIIKKIDRDDKIRLMDWFFDGFLICFCLSLVFYSNYF